MKRFRIAWRLEQICLAAGLFCSGVAAIHLLRYERFQHGGGAAVAASAPSPVRSDVAAIRAPDIRVSGRLEVPRLGVSVLVVDGDEQGGLALGPVHLADTPAVGAAGNAVIAGHRDTAFWPLRKLHVGDRVRFAKGKQRFQFRVTAIRIVSPGDVSVLESQPDGQARLTLVTCYPFRFIGSAPDRFVVEARLILSRFAAPAAPAQTARSRSGATASAALFN